MSIHLKTLNWKQAKIIDSPTAKKIIEFEQEQSRKIAEIIFDVLGFPVLLISFFLLGIDLTYQFSREMGYVMDIVTMAIFVFGFFFVIIRRFKIHKHSMIRAANVFIAIWIAAGTMMLLDFKLSLIEIIYLWTAVIIFGILVAKRDYMSLLAVNGIFFGVAYILDRTTPRLMNLDEHHWIIVAVVLLSPAVLVTIGLVKIFRKIFPFIKRLLRSGSLIWIANIFSKFNQGSRNFLEWFESWRLAILAVLVGILISTALRGRDSLLDQALWSNDKLHLISFTGFMILLLSMLVKEKSNFSIFYSIAGWIEILFRIFVVTPQGLKLTLNHFHYEPGMIALGLILVYGTLFLAKKFTSSDLPRHEITLLGPVGIFTTVILISFR
jgi:hypothetical protein